MCMTCGCGGGDTLVGGRPLRRERAQGAHMSYRQRQDGHAHEHQYEHQHQHSHAPGVSESRMVSIERDILAKNDGYARENRNYCSAHGIFALNLVSSPGSGKTTLLVKTIEALKGKLPLAVIEGDQQTDNDAARIRATGTQALQINTGKGCHLDAYMVGNAMQQLDLQDDSLLLIENVGNLVCPASFDLGEAHKVAILSVTEGEDKPLKYPDMFRAADLMLLNKCDLLPYLDFDADLAVENARRINPDIRVIRVSATKGDGMNEWLEWVAAGCHEAAAKQQHRSAPASESETGLATAQG